MNVVKFTKICELVKENEVVHFFENENQEKMRLVTKSSKDFEKDQKYKILIKKEI